MTYEKFIEKLELLGFKITYHSYDSTGGTKLFVNGIEIISKYYQIFGHISGGTYYPLLRGDKNEFSEEDLDIAIKTCSIILMERIVEISKQPTYWDCKDFLRDNFGKTKVEKDAINRVLLILNDNFQDLVKIVKGFKEYE